MKSKLKINFADFWPGLDPTNNYFYHLLSLKYDVEISNNPDLLFFSVAYGRSRYRDTIKAGKRIFYTGENVRPNFTSDNPIESSENSYSLGKCDFAFTFDFSDDERNYRLPLWVIQIDWFNKGTYGNPQFILPPDKIYDNEFIRKEKTKFCAFVFNNPIPERLEIYEKLSKYKQVDGYGKPFDNWFYGEDNKYRTLADYKFSICFENSISKNIGGYYTEKPFHAKTAGTIPLYKADAKCSYDFNTKSFVNAIDYNSIDELIEYVIEIDKNDDLYKQIFNEPLFTDRKIKEEFTPEGVLKFFEEKIIC